MVLLEVVQQAFDIVFVHVARQVDEVEQELVVVVVVERHALVLHSRALLVQAQVAVGTEAFVALKAEDVAGFLFAFFADQVEGVVRVLSREMKVQVAGQAEALGACVAVDLLCIAFATIAVFHS